MISKGIAAEKPANTWDVATVLDVASVSQNTLSEFFESFDGKYRMWVSQGINRKLSAKMKLLSAGEFARGTTLYYPEALGPRPLSIREHLHKTGAPRITRPALQVLPRY